MHNNNKVLFTLSPLALATLVALGAPVQAQAESGNPFIDDSHLSGSLNWFHRNRTQKDASGQYKPNLNHDTLSLGLDFSSGYIADTIGFDASLYSGTPITEDGNCSEMALCGAKGDWKPDASYALLGRAYLKAKFGEGDYQANVKAGYVGMGGIGVLSDVWSIFPGTYQGFNITGKVKNLDLAYGWANEFREPWARDYHKFTAGSKEIDYVHSFGAKYSLDNGFYVEGGFGQSKDFMNRYMAKVGHSFQIDDQTKLDINGQYYAGKKGGDLWESSGAKPWEGTGHQEVLSAALNHGPWTFSAEYIQTTAKADNGGVGVFIPRMLGDGSYGKVGGRLDYWWNSISDWAYDGERAYNLGVKYDFASLGYPGLTAGTNLMKGSNITYRNADGSVASKDGKEWALNLDLGYTLQDGPLKGLGINAHYTNYNIVSPSAGDSGIWPNKDRRDLKVMMSYSKQFF
ncbi:OprD family outer membrane porin [Balneatrix alpica]|uniref:OprD family outer membrane porin n=1 Tax=Balneatrix alpica TaxID=75684 RepID=UPI002739A56F|nr:OprD family outer membrane porin [Balneatrix alpica]